MKTAQVIYVATLFIAAPTHAAVSGQEAKRLSTVLTPWGAVKAGNKEGTIPAYTGGLPVTTSPPGFKRNSGHWADPFAHEKPLYTITARNVGKYADKLNEVTKEMLKRFPTYRLNVYPTHRVVNYPQHFIESSIKNATRCKTIHDELALEGCLGGVPFPIAKTGYEHMWNVQLGYWKPYLDQHDILYVDAKGEPTVLGTQQTTLQSPYHDPGQTLKSFYAQGAYYLRAKALSMYPPREAGDGLVFLSSVNPIKFPPKNWVFQRENPRAREVPEAQYDYPTVVSGGAQFYDELFLYQGKMDRYDFKYLGTKEMIIPYSNYRAVEARPEEWVANGGGRHPNPDLIRWELHRVHVVEANLKQGMRHAYAKRRFYIDEDQSKSGVTDTWNHAGQLYRSYMSMLYWIYDKQTISPPPISIEFDLTTGVWYMAVLYGNQPGVTIRSDSDFFDSDFTPEAITPTSAK